MDTAEETSNDGRESDGEEHRGCPLDAIYHNRPPFVLSLLDDVGRSEQHTVLYELPYQPNADRPPEPYLATDTPTPSATVRLPLAVLCMMRNADGSHAIESRWSVVCRALAKPILNARELVAAIQQYNPDYRTRYQFTALHQLLDEQCDDTERGAFFGETLPQIIKLALQLPELIRAPIPLLGQRRIHSVSMTQQQAACLLANAFLCTFPLLRSAHTRTYAAVNFVNLFSGTTQSVVEKLKCICHYFRRVCTEMPTGVLTYERRHLSRHELPDWATNDTCFDRERVPLHISPDGTIEDQGDGLLQMVFANRFIGGGVLGHGCVQEEIRFVISPELLVGRFLFESLRETEAYIVAGAERYCTYVNYAATFAFAGDYRDAAPRDASGRRRVCVVGLDALRIQPGTDQYDERTVRRELAKAYVGFRRPGSVPPEPTPGIATGNWGCGAFGGHAPLKALLQLMVGCVTGRPMVYFTCNEPGLHRKLLEMYRFLTERRVRVSELFRVLLSYAERDPVEREGLPDVYSYVYGQLP